MPSVRGAPAPSRRPVKPMDLQAAVQVCRLVKEGAARQDCVFDVTVTGDAGMAEAYRRTLELRHAAAARP